MGDVAAAGLAGALLAAAGGWVLELADRSSGGMLVAAYRRFLFAGGWLKLPLAFAAIGALRSVLFARTPSVRLAAAVTAIGLAVCSLTVVIVPAQQAERAPRGVAGKARAILRASFKSPEAVLRIVRMGRDPDPRVRELAMLALGENVVVAAFQKAEPTTSATDARVRDSLQATLTDALVGDASESVRGEAARALWRAPRAFGEQPAAAETLAAMLDRADRQGALERLSWIALDAVAGHPHASLRAAATRFARTTPDTELARAARVALERSGRPTPPSDINTR